MEVEKDGSWNFLEPAYRPEHTTLLAPLGNGRKVAVTICAPRGGAEKVTRSARGLEGVEVRSRIGLIEMR